jgi:hypothetical protein
LADEEAARRQLELFARDWLEDPVKARQALMEDFEARARLGTLGPLESLAGQYALYAKDPAYGGYLLMSLLLRLPASKRIYVHNWAIAGDMPRATREAYGGAISRLARPLFPCVPGLAAANAKLLQDSTHQRGTGDRTKHRPSRRSRRRATAGRSGPCGPRSRRFHRRKLGRLSRRSPRCP